MNSFDRAMKFFGLDAGRGVVYVLRPSASSADVASRSVSFGLTLSTFPLGAQGPPGGAWAVEEGIEVRGGRS